MKLNTIKSLISKTLIDSDISQDQFVLVNDALIKHSDIKKTQKSW